MASQTVRGVAAGSGRFVAVGGDGRVWRSDVDGTRWRCAAHPVATGLYAVARGSGRFVAVGIGGAVLTSPDGRHWTPRRSGTNVNLHAVAWLGNHFLAGGDGGTLLRSRDGRQWRREGYPAFHSIRAFTWDPASGATVGTGAGSIAHRRAGGPWQVITPVGQGQFHTGAAFGEGAFVVSGHAGGLLVSPDAAAWSPAASGVERNLDALIRTADGFVTAGAGIALASSDGTTWTPIPWPTARAPRSMARQGSTLIAVGDARTVVRRVGDGPARLGHLPDCARTTG
ncbi:MAG: hypothetical protein FJW92_04545 [Actinobacteria bacterium]|nr:hypothetical protein [Actinomycetota bacterium]